MGQYGAQYCLVLGGTATGSVLFGTWWYWVSVGRYWLVLGGNGSTQGGAG